MSTTTGAAAGIHDVAVIGAGLVGSAVAYGLSVAGAQVAVLDEGDIAWRASRGNFGLVWVQSKGMGLPAYSRWTLQSARIWRSLADRLLEETGVDVHLEQPGGVTPLLSEQEVEARVGFMQRLHAQPGITPYEWKLIDRKEVEDIVPGLGPEVRAAIWTPEDGIVNPLKLLRALHTAFGKRGVTYLPQRPAQSITLREGVFELATPQGPVRARRIVLTAGLGNGKLGEQIGLPVPVRPQRGQIVVLERTRRLLRAPCLTLRQTDEGTWLIGDSQEEAGYDDQSAGLPVLATLADRAVRTIPALREVRVVRTWSALRVMSRDGFPIYQQSTTHPGAFVATCHSGVTLAAAHALALAPMIAQGALAPELADFSMDRFHVQTNLA
jgi:glycine/D-amino acid oxidase-like deaminating enzyme